MTSDERSKQQDRINQFDALGIEIDRVMKLIGVLDGQSVTNVEIVLRASPDGQSVTNVEIVLRASPEDLGALGRLLQARLARLDALRREV